MINVSHLGERIVERIGDGGRFGLRIAYSREADVPGLAPAGATNYHVTSSMARENRRG